MIIVTARRRTDGAIAYLTNGGLTPNRAGAAPFKSYTTAEFAAKQITANTNGEWIAAAVSTKLTPHVEGRS